MRKLAPFLAVAALLCLAPLVPAPVGPTEAHAIDDPAFIDGGSIVTVIDGGSTTTIDTGITNSWPMAITAENQPVRYKMCEVCAGCLATSVNQLLQADRIFDIQVPNNRRCLSLFAEDGGAMRVNVQRVTP